MYNNLQVMILNKHVLCILYKKLNTNVWAVSYAPHLILQNSNWKCKQIVQNNMP